jgi:hypothetical protein
MDDVREIIPLSGRYVEKVNDQTLETSLPANTYQVERPARLKPAPEKRFVLPELPTIPERAENESIFRCDRWKCVKGKRANPVRRAVESGDEEDLPGRFQKPLRWQMVTPGKRSKSVLVS